MDEALPDRPKKGRGAVSNPDNRFESTGRVAIDDGWGPIVEGTAEGASDGASPAGYEEAAGPETEAPLRTVVLADSSKSVIVRNDSPDVPFEKSVNPYRGCEHGCIYCFARPSHAFLGLSPGLDFETRILAKHKVAELLEKELAKPSYKPQPIALGTNTDPYQPSERRLKLTRQILEVLWQARNPVTIVTKSNLVLRDLDILAPMAAQGLAKVCVSVTTLDRDLARVMEPRAATPTRRLEAIRELAEAGVPSGIMAAPMIPALNDSELEALLEAGKEAGAVLAGYVLLRLPLELKTLFEEWLEAHYPDRKERVLNQLREARGGELYVARWGERMRGRGIQAELLARRFDLAAKRLGLNYQRESWTLDTSQFLRPQPKSAQLSLF